MNIKFTAKNIKFNESMKQFTIKRLKNIEKISGDIIEAEMIVSEGKIDFRVELNLKSRLHSYHIEETDPILKQAVRNTLNRIKSQAKKNKDKIKLEKKRKNKKEKYRVISPETPMEPIKEETDNTIAISNNFSRKPLSIDEAIFFLKESQENAYMFLNADNNKMSVVFFDRKNNISIIEEDT